MKNFSTLLLVLLTSCLWAQNVQVFTITEEFSGSGGVKLGPDGLLYIADFGQGLGQADGRKVWRLDPDSGQRTEFASGLQGASGNAFDSQGNLFQSNIAGNHVSKITPDGSVSTFVSQGIFSPVGIAIDEEDNLYVCNCGSHTIQKVSPQGTSTVFADGNIFRCPNGITRDANGNLYVSNFGNGSIIRVTPEGQASLFAIIPGSNNGHLTYYEPFDVLFVNSHGSSSVYKLTLDGEVTRIAGTGTRGNQDGPAERATFSRPNGIAASVTGDTLFLNSSIPTVDDPANNVFPLNPSVVRMITGVRGLFTTIGTAEEKAAVQARIFPNPAQRQAIIALEIAQADEFELLVMDTAGKEVLREDWGQLPAGTHQKELQLGPLPAGHYFVAIIGRNTSYTLPLQLTGQ